MITEFKRTDGPSHLDRVGTRLRQWILVQWICRNDNKHYRKSSTWSKVGLSFDQLQTALNASSDETYEALERAPSQYLPHNTYELAKGDLRHYQQQYVDMYFLRLAKLKPIVEEVAQEAWADIEVGQTPIAKVNSSI